MSVLLSIYQSTLSSVTLELNSFQGFFKVLSATDTGVWENVVSLPRGVRGGSPAKIEFSKISMPKKLTGGTHFTLPNKNFPNLVKHAFQEPVDALVYLCVLIPLPAVGSWKLFRTGVSKRRNEWDVTMSVCFIWSASAVRHQKFSARISRHLSDFMWKIID